MLDEKMEASVQNGADDGTRTRTLCREADFRTTSAFAAAFEAFVVWTVPSPSPEGLRRRPSSLYTFPGHEGPGLGSGLAWSHTAR